LWSPGALRCRRFLDFGLHDLDRRLVLVVGFVLAMPSSDRVLVDDALDADGRRLRQELTERSEGLLVDP
jgi:hypothetical protein